jgi:hypothetical protein
MPFLDDDIVDLRRDNGKSWQYYWGDPLERVPAEDTATAMRVRMIGRTGRVDEGFISKSTAIRAKPVTRFSMIDVQQGDGMILETGGGKVLFIDAGEIKLFARHVAARYPGTSAAKPLIVDAIVVTHGDADHFAGLAELRKSETHDNPSSRVFVTARRVYHNGLVKRPGSLPGTTKKRPDKEMFGATKEKNGRTFATELANDPRHVPPAERNQYFAEWCDLLDFWEQRLLATTGETMEVRRLDQTTTDAFDFLAGEHLVVDLFGPVTENIDGKPALELLRKPKDDVSIILGTQPLTSGTVSASHTINGHSVNFRLRQANVRFLFTGDMNQESMQRMREVLPDLSLRSEILKTPHHGSADFDFAFLQEVSPVVSLVSSGDESVRHEHIHPRATLMAALGKASRQMPAILFSTELAAFFAYRGPSTDKKVSSGQKANYEGFERLNYGIIHVRTDGERVLAFTHSGKRGMNEAYRFTVSATGEIKFAAKAVSRSAPKL